MERTIHAYNRLFNRYWKDILNFCNKKLHDKDAATDVAQNSFIKLWDNLEKPENDNNAKRFVYMCAKNECLNILNIRQRRHTVDPILISDTLFEDMKWDYDIIESEVMAFIFESINELSERRQQTIKLYLKGYNSHEIAKKLGCTEKTALNQKLTAISYLRNKVKLKFGI